MDLLGEGFDVAVRMGDLPDDALLVASKLAVFTLGLYAAPDYLAAHGDPQTPDDLTRHTAIRLLRGHGEAAVWTLLQGAERWEAVPVGRLSANSPEMLMRLARAGAGIAALPDGFAQQAVREGTLRRVLPDWRLPSSTAWAVYPGRKLMPAKTRALVDMLQRALGGCSQAPDSAPLQEAPTGMGRDDCSDRRPGRVH